MFFINWQGLGLFKAALELHKDGEGPSRLPTTVTTEKGRQHEPRSPKDWLSGDVGGVQSPAHGSM